MLTRKFRSRFVSYLLRMPPPCQTAELSLQLLRARRKEKQHFEELGCSFKRPRQDAAAWSETSPPSYFKHHLNSFACALISLSRWTINLFMANFYILDNSRARHRCAAVHIAGLIMISSIFDACKLFPIFRSFIVLAVYCKWCAILSTRIGFWNGRDWAWYCQRSLWTIDGTK